MSDKTPAPSGRFLPSSSASNHKPFSSSSVKKPTAVFSQLRPSSTSASPFSRASRFQTPSRIQRDAINTSFDDDGVTTAEPKLQISTPYASNGVDAIDAIDEEDVGLAEAGLVSLAQRDFSDADEDVIKTWTNTSAQHDDIETPFPKRRRLSRHDRIPKESIMLSSSPADAANVDYAEAMADEYSDLDEEDMSPAKALKSPQNALRFRSKTPAGPALETVEQKPVFRPPDSGSRLAAEMTTVLPEAFTPSRRKGKKEYIAGGLADTIRNMVLGVATEAATKGGLDEAIVSISNAALDSSERAIIATDHDNVQWILPLQRDRGTPEALSQKLDSIQRTGQVLLLGNATNWALPFDQSDARGDVRFAAHWSVVREQ